MALTDADVLRFDGPSIWGETDCLAWLQTITGLTLHRSIWYGCETEARAIRRAHKVHGSYTAAVLQGLRCRGYRSIPLYSQSYLTGDVVIVRDPVYGELPAGVAEGPQLLIRHPYGVAVAGGTQLYHLRIP